MDKQSIQLEPQMTEPSPNCVKRLRNRDRDKSLPPKMDQQYELIMHWKENANGS